MELSHAGHVLYMAMVVGLFGSPLWIAWLVRGWRQRRPGLALVQAVVAVLLVASLAYVLMRWGP